MAFGDKLLFLYELESPICIFAVGVYRYDLSGGSRDGRGREAGTAVGGKTDGKDKKAVRCGEPGRESGYSFFL